MLHYCMAYRKYPDKFATLTQSPRNFCIGYRHNGKPTNDALRMQRILHNCRKQGYLGDVDEILLGGAKGPGKSSGAVMDVQMDIGMNPLKKKKYYIFRRSFPELESQIIDEFIKHAPSESEGFYHYNSTKHRFDIFNGSVVYCRVAENFNDVRTKFNGLEMQYLVIDQAEEWLEEEIEFLGLQCRSTDPEVRPKIILTANPGGRSDGYLTREFVNRGTPNVPFEVVTDMSEIKQMAIEMKLKESIINRIPEIITKRRIYIPGIVVENEYMNIEYLATLKNITDPERKRQLLWGDWTAKAGQYFKEWNFHKHTCPDFVVPRHWKRYRTIDWGYHPHPAVCKWFAVDEFGKVYSYRELRVFETVPSEFGKQINELSLYMDAEDGKLPDPEQYEWTAYDPNCNRKSEGGRTIIQNIGIPGILADNARIPGWLCLRELYALTLKSWENNSSHAGIQYFRNACKNSIENIPTLVHDDKHPEDLDSTGWDDEADCDRYFAKLWYTPAEKIKKKTDNPYLQKIWEDMQKPVAKEPVYDEVLGSDF